MRNMEHYKQIHRSIGPIRKKNTSQDIRAGERGGDMESAVQPRTIPTLRRKETLNACKNTTAAMGGTRATHAANQSPQKDAGGKTGRKKMRG